MEDLKALEELQNLQNSDDTEAAHCRADEILCELITALGFPEVVEAWEKVPKWYA